MKVHSQSGHRAEVTNMIFKTSMTLSTRVCSGKGALWQIAPILQQSGCGKRVLVLTQPALQNSVARSIQEDLTAAGFTVALMTVPDGESGKGQEQLFSVWNRLQELSCERKDTLLAVGGGAVTDLAGFAASTYLRGIKLVLVPTTLLAQVDASIGGKTGINLMSGKNLAGTFYFPQAVIVDPETLRSLPEREMRSGLGEIVKYAFIEKTVAVATDFRGTPRPFARILEECIAQGFDANNVSLQGIIDTCIKMKLAVVAKDPFEGELRRCLNLGHTLAHALEKVTNHALSHGEAVAIGLVFASRLSLERELIAQEEFDSVLKLVKLSGLPFEIPEGLSRDEIAHYIAFDKKRQDDGIKFVLPTSPLGTVDLGVSIPVDKLINVLP